MQSAQIRNTFLEFFRSKGHEIVPSAPMIIKDDPTLMFTNAGMNQFKDIFLGNATPKNVRVTDTQKCLRVSGKHNDLEEVGVDTYHHTMFEMLGNWSFGDYFKKETIAWAYELLIDVYKLDKSRMYVTYFNGDEKDGLQPDKEAKELWSQFFPEDHILGCGKKDNFWEMGETGPCGPCSEIHVDLRRDDEIKKIPGRDLVNQSHPLVIEIWNLVFIEFNRNKDQSLSKLPNKHVDTGMGLERLAMALQAKKSNYDTDIFMSLIRGFEKELDGINYDHSDSEADIAFRVVVDHLRAVSIAIAEGQLPSNTGAGYVIRRILRRAIRYAYSFLGAKQPVINRLVPYLVDNLGSVFTELSAQSTLVQKVIREEEDGFLRTLEKGIERFEKYVEAHPSTKEVDGKFAFELYDTYGFPVDLTDLLAAERKIGVVNKKEFNEMLNQQKNRSRAATKVDADDWVQVREDDIEEFIGYDHVQAEVVLVKYRKISQGKKELYQLVFNLTPFYPEGGGQVGDTGYIESDGQKIMVIDTKKENNLILHITESLPANTKDTFNVFVNVNKRRNTERNHSATHLLHHVLRKTLGTHVEQKGSLVHPDHLRFDFSHFEKVSDKQLHEIERAVNEAIRQGLELKVDVVPFSKAKEMGAMALFGEKYGDVVRVITFGNSVELCGGTHVRNSALIGQFKIKSEGSVAAGIRRIEAITGEASDNYLNEQLSLLNEVKTMLKNPSDIKMGLKKVLDEHQALKNELDQLKNQQLQQYGKELIASATSKNGVTTVIRKTELNAEDLKNLTMDLTGKNANLFIALGSGAEGKANISISIGKNALKSLGLSARVLIMEVAPLIKGGGGGQEHFASAGGKHPEGLEEALRLIDSKISI